MFLRFWYIKLLLSFNSRNFEIPLLLFFFSTEPTGLQLSATSQPSGVFLAPWFSVLLSVLPLMLSSSVLLWSSSKQDVLDFLK